MAESIVANGSSDKPIRLDFARRIVNFNFARLVLVFDSIVSDFAAPSLSITMSGLRFGFPVEQNTRYPIGPITPVLRATMSPPDFEPNSKPSQYLLTAPSLSDYSFWTYFYFRARGQNAGDGGDEGGGGGDGTNDAYAFGSVVMANPGRCFPTRKGIITFASSAASNVSGGRVSVSLVKVKPQEDIVINNDFRLSFAPKHKELMDTLLGDEVAHQSVFFDDTTGPVRKIQIDLEKRTLTGGDA